MYQAEDVVFQRKVLERTLAVGKTLVDYGLKAATGRVQFDKCREYALPERDKDACKLIWAENVQRYAIRPSQRRVGKEWLDGAITSALEPNITGSGIVVRRATAKEQPRRIIAAQVTPDGLSARHTYFESGTDFISLDGMDHPLFFLAALNSCFAEFAFRRLNSNTHVSARDINSLPFPPMSDEATVVEIEECAAEILAKGGVDASRADVPRIIGLELRLDDLIGSLYGFDEEEVFDVQTALPADHSTIYDVTEEEEDEHFLTYLLRAGEEEAKSWGFADLERVREALAHYSPDEG